MKEAGYEPEVKKAYSLAQLPDVTPGRREVKRLSGESWVPLLVTDDGEVVERQREHHRLGEGAPEGQGGGLTPCGAGRR